MGIEVRTEITTVNSVTPLAAAYVCFIDTDDFYKEYRNGDGTYTLSGTFAVYENKVARDGGKSYFHTLNIIVVKSDTSYKSGDQHVLMYNALKVAQGWNVTNITDII